MDFDYEKPIVTTREKDLKKVEVVLVCEGIEASGGKKKNADVIIKHTEESLTVEAQVTKKKGDKVNYRQVIKKLPGKIEGCEAKYKKDQIILELKKKEECSWAAQLSANGLEQASSSDDSD